MKPIVLVLAFVGNFKIPALISLESHICFREKQLKDWNESNGTFFVGKSFVKKVLFEKIFINKSYRYTIWLSHIKISALFDGW